MKKLIVILIVLISILTIIFVTKEYFSKEISNNSNNKTQDNRNINEEETIPNNDLFGKYYNKASNRAALQNRINCAPNPCLPLLPHHVQMLYIHICQQEQ